MCPLGGSFSRLWWKTYPDVSDGAVVFALVVGNVPSLRSTAHAEEVL
jgi:hypothetical protein